MTCIKLDAETCNQIKNAPGMIEFCDEHGTTLGYFVAGEPKPGQPPPGFEIPLSIEEIQRRRGTRTGRTLDEILRGMGVR